MLLHKYQTAQKQDGNDNRQLTEDMSKWLLSEIGEYRILGYRGSPRNKTWNISCATGVHYFKLFSKNHRWNNEVSFYKNWSEVYPFCIPELIGIYKGEKERGILTLGLEGILFTNDNFGTEITSSIYEKAGELCKKPESLDVGQRFGLLSKESILFDDEDNLIDIETASDPRIFVSNKIQTLYKFTKEQKVLTHQEERVVKDALNRAEVFSGELPVLVNKGVTLKQQGYLEQSRKVFEQISFS